MIKRKTTNKGSKDKQLLLAIISNIKTACLSKLYQLKLGNYPVLSDLSDVENIPFTTKQDLRDWYPYGNLATDFTNIIEMHTTSGTTGKPTLSFYTKRDLEEGSKEIAKAWKNFGIDKNCRVQFMMGYGLFSGATLNTYAIQSLGAFVLPAGVQSTVKQVQMLQDFDIDTMVATPSYYLHLYDYLVQNNIPIKSLKLKRGIAAGEAYSDDLKKKIADLFSMKIYDHYGLCEVNTGIIYECKSCSGMVVLDEYVYSEVIDPETGKILPDGQLGELVLTSLRKEASPVIRYRTGDMTSIRTRFSECKECSGSTVVERIRLRYDSTIFYKGIKIEPFELRDMIICFLGDSMYNRVRIQVRENTFQEQPKIFIALKPDINRSILNKLKEHLKERTSVTFIVEEVPYSYFGEFTSTKDKIVEYIK